MIASSDSAFRPTGETMEETIQSDSSIFGDLAQVEKTLSDDLGGERARSMLAYFDAVRKSSEAMLAKPLSDGDRHFVTQLIEGFRAAQRIIQHVWETLHSASLPV
jgi:hypothetical protein